jgi:hypothetical protein
VEQLDGVPVTMKPYSEQVWVHHDSLPFFVMHSASAVDCYMCSMSLPSSIDAHGAMNEIGRMHHEGDEQESAMKAMSSPFPYNQPPEQTCKTDICQHHCCKRHKSLLLFL